MEHTRFVIFGVEIRGGGFQTILAVYLLYYSDISFSFVIICQDRQLILLYLDTMSLAMNNWGQLVFQVN